MTGIVEKLDSLADDLERDDNVCWLIVAEARAEIERLTKEVEGLRRPVTMQDVRLACGEGKLTAADVITGCNAELRRRAALPREEGA